MKQTVLVIAWLPWIVIGGVAALIYLGLQAGFRMACAFVIAANEEGR